jgi:hypothetical protein
MLLRVNWIRQCCHDLCCTHFQVNVNSLNSVANSNSEIERTIIKEETDPLLITFQDMQGKNEVCMYVHGSITAYRGADKSLAHNCVQGC